MMQPKSATIQTSSDYRAYDVTDTVERLLGNESGYFLVSTPHTTCALFLSEVDEELLRDWERLGQELLKPFEPFTHIRNNVPNASAHMISSMFGTSLLLSGASGSFDLGRYQRMVLLELDGPKDRTIMVRQVAGSESDDSS